MTNPTTEGVAETGATTEGTAETGATTGGTADAGATQASETANRTYTREEVEAAKRGLVKEQQRLKQELEEKERLLREHEEATMSDLEKAHRAAEAAEALAQQHEAKIAQMEADARRSMAASVLGRLGVANPELIAVAVPDGSLETVEAVEEWAKERKLIQEPGGNLPAGPTGAMGARAATTSIYNCRYRKLED